MHCMRICPIDRNEPSSIANSTNHLLIRHLGICPSCTYHMRHTAGEFARVGMTWYTQQWRSFRSCREIQDLMDFSERDRSVASLSCSAAWSRFGLPIRNTRTIFVHFFKTLQTDFELPIYRHTVVGWAKAICFSVQRA